MTLFAYLLGILGSLIVFFIESVTIIICVVRNDNAFRTAHFRFRQNIKLRREVERSNNS